MPLRIVVEIQEDVSTETGRAEAVRLLRTVGDRIGDGAGEGYIQGPGSHRSKAEWSTAVMTGTGKARNERAN